VAKKRRSGENAADTIGEETGRDHTSFHTAGVAFCRYSYQAAHTRGQATATCLLEIKTGEARHVVNIIGGIVIAVNFAARGGEFNHISLAWLIQSDSVATNKDCCACTEKPQTNTTEANSLPDGDHARELISNPGRNSVDKAHISCRYIRS